LEGFWPVCLIAGLVQLITRVSRDHERYVRFCGHDFNDKLELIMGFTARSGPPYCADAWPAIAPSCSASLSCQSGLKELLWLGAPRIGGSVDRCDREGSVRHRGAILIAAAVACSGFLVIASAMSAQTAPAARATTLSSGTWGTAEEVPGSAALNAGGRAAINSVSCSSAGNCAAGGSYASASPAKGPPITQAMVVTETDGTWGTAIELPGTATLNAGGAAQISSISCSAPGDCSAGGQYTDSSGRSQAFVATETGGTWKNARKVPGTSTLNHHTPGAQVLSVSCGAAGDCAAGGSYTDASGQQQAFVVTETGGTWGTAQEVPGTAAMNAGGYAEIDSVSCAAAGECTAGGLYASSSTDSIPTVQALVVTETGGTWGTAEEVPGTDALNSGGYAEITSVSCAAAGECSAGGEYTDSTSGTEAFVVSQTGGTWSTAQEVPGIQYLNRGGLAVVNSVSCAAAGDCSAVGTYTDANFANQAFYVNESGGTWGPSHSVPYTKTLDSGSPGATAVSVSCGAVGDCSLGGHYFAHTSGIERAFVASETGGVWGAAEQVPGAAVTHKGEFGATQSVSCPSTGNCAAGGLYPGSPPAGQQAWVADETASS
jgi:hypothetical protein